MELKQRGLRSNRVAQIPSYLFAQINRKKKTLMDKGVDVIDLGIGAPDLPTPVHIVERLVQELQDPSQFVYSPFQGIREFREAVAHYYDQHFGVHVDPEQEVLTLIGSKEGIGHFIPAVIDPGDDVLIPDPGYAVYERATQLAGGHPQSLPLKREWGYQPDFSKIPESVKQSARLMFLNYPNNPTSATAERSDFVRHVQFAKEHDILIAHDAAYQMLGFDQQAPSILEVEGAKDIAVEFGSLSKTYNMTGWRIGYVVGNRDMIDALSVMKSNMDTSQFIPIQKAGSEALLGEQDCVEQNKAVFRERMTYMVEQLQDLGLEVDEPQAAFYVWAKVPAGFSTESFVNQLLDEAGVIVTPGSAFGKQGEGYFRIALTVPTDRLQEAAARIRKLL